MSEFTVQEVKIVDIGHIHGYNRSEVRYRVEVSMFSENVTLPHVQQQIESMIHVFYPRRNGIGGSRVLALEYKGITRIDEHPSTRQDGEPWEYHVGVWEFTYKTDGTD